VQRGDFGHLLDGLLLTLREDLYTVDDFELEENGFTLKVYQLRAAFDYAVFLDYNGLELEREVDFDLLVLEHLEDLVAVFEELHVLDGGVVFVQYDVIEVELLVDPLGHGKHLLEFIVYPLERAVGQEDDAQELRVHEQVLLVFGLLPLEVADFASAVLHLVVHELLEFLVLAHNLFKHDLSHGQYYRARFHHSVLLLPHILLVVGLFSALGELGANGIVCLGFHGVRIQCLVPLLGPFGGKLDAFVDLGFLLLEPDYIVVFLVVCDIAV